MDTYAVVDLEATNHPTTSEKYIIQIGITFIENNHVTQTQTVDIKPPVPISETITALTGITNEQVSQALLFEDVAEYIVTLLEGCVFVAHNSVFDYTLLCKELNRCGYELPKMSVLDTLDMAQMILPNRSEYSLKKLCELLDIDLDSHHHAGCDSRATAFLFLMLKEKIAQLSNTLQQTIRWLLNEKNDDLAQLFDTDTSDDLTDVIRYPENVTLLKKSFLVTVLPMLSNKEVPLYYSYYHFADIDRILQLVKSPARLTIQEVKQLCRILVYLSQESCDGLLAELGISNKLLYKVNAINYSNPYYQRFLATYTNELIISVQDFVTDYYYLATILFNEHTHIQVMQGLLFDRYARQSNVKTLPVSALISEAISIKNDLSMRVSHTQLLDMTTLTLFTILDDLKEKCQVLLEKVLPNSSQSYYMDKVSRINKKWLQQFKEVIEQLYQVSKRVHLKNVIQHLDGCLTGYYDNEYMTVTIQKAEFHTYFTVSIQPFTIAEFLEYGTLMYGHSVSIDGYFPNLPIVQDYLALFFSKSVVFNRITSSEKRLLHVMVTKNAQTWKDNLLIKKVVKLSETLSEKTIIVVPNNEILQAIKEQNDELLVALDQRSKKVWEQFDVRQTVLYTTWRVFYEQCSHIKDVDKVILLKLPFEVPNSLQYQASRHYLPETMDYFSHVSLVSTTLDLLHVMMTTPLSTRVEIWDGRVVNSVYAQKMQMILSECIKIVEQ